MTSQQHEAPDPQINSTGPLWRWTSDNGPAAWFFLTITGDAGEEVSAHEAMARLESGKGRGFGSVKVSAMIGDSRWSTSIFPSKTEDGWLLPVKAAIRKAEGLVEGDQVTAALTLL